MPKFCPKCGTKVLVPGAKFCMECGLSFEQLTDVNTSNSAKSDKGMTSMAIVDNNSPAESQNNERNGAKKIFATLLEKGQQLAQSGIQQGMEYAEKGRQAIQEKYDAVKSSRNPQDVSSDSVLAIDGNSSSETVSLDDKKKESEAIAKDNAAARVERTRKIQEYRAKQQAEMETELKECQSYAERGHKLAQDNYDDMCRTLEEEREKLQAADDEQSKLDRVQNSQLIEEQKNGLAELTDQIKQIGTDISMLHERQKDFSIIIYGRTMAGKSTLMEILTHGNGQSIGKGAQRTTLDVRDYYWNGLRITDVPGVCSFGGAEDDRLAFEAARSADLILFLLTDDAPQAGEAECLAQLRSLGKPVLGIVNVKMSFDINRRKLALRNLEKKLADTERIDAICQQFKSFAGNYQQDWSDIQFVYTHLNAAFQAQPERADDEEVFAASRFGKVESFILDKVRTDGKFLRIKNFVDIAAVPTQHIMAEIYAHAARAMSESLIWRNKRIELYEWKGKFLERTQQRYDHFRDHVYSQVTSALDDFVEKNYESKNAGEDWEKVIDSLNLQKQCDDFLQEIADECDRKRKELSDELTQEIKYTFSNSASVSVEMGGTTPYAKYAWHIASNALMFVPGIGWAARIGIGVGGALLGMLFNNKEDNIRENKAKLREAIAEGTDPMLTQVFDNVLQVMNGKILGEGIDGFAATLADMEHTLAHLGKSQAALAFDLMDKYRSINTELLQEAIAYSDQPGFVSSIENIARIPGKRFLLIADQGRLNQEKIGSLIGDDFKMLKSEKDEEARRNMIVSILGGEVDQLNYCYMSDDENAEYTAFITTKSAVNETNRILTEQIVGVPIVEGATK